MPDKRIKLLLLDFDGTLVDTRRANALAYVATLREAGYALTEEEYAARYFGMRCDEFLTRLGVADPAQRERLRLRKIALYPSFFDTVRLNRPLWKFCRAFRAQGGRVWIVSTGSRANIDNVMRFLGIEGPSSGPGRGGGKPSFAAGPKDDDPNWPCNPLVHADTPTPAAASAGIDPPIGGSLLPNAAACGCVDGMLSGAEEANGCGKLSNAEEANGWGMLSNAAGAIGAVDGILSGADVARSKPFPDCFLEAMRREGCTADETLIFEDSPIGLEAARRSGAAYIRVVL